MEKFEKLSGIAAPMPLVNIDTDMIIPKVFLKTIKRSGLGVNLFDEMRYDRQGNEIADFVLNKPAYREAQILVAGDNFGCGSSLASSQIRISGRPPQPGRRRGGVIAGRFAVASGAVTEQVVGRELRNLRPGVGQQGQPFAPHPEPGLQTRSPAPLGGTGL